MSKYLKPKLDIVFRMLFGDESNADILEAFLLAVMNIPREDVELITVLNPFFSLSELEHEESLVYIKVSLKSGRRVNVEIQMWGNPRRVPDLRYYKAKMVTGQIGPNVPYMALEPTSYIAILDYPMYDDAYCQHTFRLYDHKRKVQFSDYEEIHVLELPKLEQDDSNPGLRDWLRFLNTEDKEEFDMLSEKNEAMKNAVGVLADLSDDEQARMLAEAREKELRGQIRRELGAEKKGRSERDAEIINNMLRNGFSLADIQKATGYTETEIEQLKS